MGDMLLTAVESGAYVYIEFPALCDLQNLNILGSLGLVWCCIRYDFGFGASLSWSLRNKSLISLQLGTEPRQGPKHLNY